jgi:hypothetical protein
MEVQIIRQIDANKCFLEESRSCMKEHLEENEADDDHALPLSLSLNPITCRNEKSSTSDSSCVVSSSNGGDTLNLDLTLSVPGL